MSTTAINLFITHLSFVSTLLKLLSQEYSPRNNCRSSRDMVVCSTGSEFSILPGCAGLLQTSDHIQFWQYMHGKVRNSNPGVAGIHLGRFMYYESLMGPLRPLFLFVEASWLPWWKPCTKLRTVPVVTTALPFCFACWTAYSAPSNVFHSTSTSGHSYTSVCMDMITFPLARRCLPFSGHGVGLQ